MKHSVFFNNAENHWDNALPLGNGVFGTMLYFEGGTLYMPLNHYEVYYNINDSVLPSTFEKDDLAVIADADSIGKEGCSYGEAHRACIKKADGNISPRASRFVNTASPESKREIKRHTVSPSFQEAIR